MHGNTNLTCWWEIFQGWYCQDKNSRSTYEALALFFLKKGTENKWWHLQNLCAKIPSQCPKFQANVLHWALQLGNNQDFYLLETWLCNAKHMQIPWKWIEAKPWKIRCIFNKHQILLYTLCHCLGGFKISAMRLVTMNDLPQEKVYFADYQVISILT